MSSGSDSSTTCCIVSSKLIERVQLLAHETFFGEVCGDDMPRIVLVQSVGGGVEI